MKLWKEFELFGLCLIIQVPGEVRFVGFGEPVTTCQSIVQKGSIGNKLLVEQGTADRESPGTCLPNFGKTFVGIDRASRNDRNSGRLDYFAQKERRIANITVAQQIHTRNAFALQEFSMRDNFVDRK